MKTVICRAFKFRDNYKKFREIPPPPTPISGFDHDVIILDNTLGRENFVGERKTLRRTEFTDLTFRYDFNNID